MSGWGEKIIHEGSLQVFIPEHVELTDLSVRRRNYRDYQIVLPELQEFNLQPYLFFTLYPDARHGKPVQLEVYMAPLVNPKYQGRYLEKKPAKVEVEIVRPAPRHPITIRLGAQRDIGEFQDHKSVPLIRYTLDEESRWHIQVVVQRFE